MKLNISRNTHHFFLFLLLFFTFLFWAEVNRNIQYEHIIYSVKHWCDTCSWVHGHQPVKMPVKFVNFLHQGLSAASVKQEESPNVAEYNITGCEATHREFAKQGHSGEGTVLWQNRPSCSCHHRMDRAVSRDNDHTVCMNVCLGMIYTTVQWFGVSMFF